MRIRPLTGHVLVEILPDDSKSAGGIEIPHRSLSAEEVQEQHADPQMPAPWTGRVVAIGDWPKLRNGLLAMPEYGVGARVIISRHAGVQMQRNIGQRFRMVRQRDVLAIVTQGS